MAELVSYQSAITIIGEKDGYRLDDKLISSIVYPFIVKSSEWKYEKEVRCLLTKNSPSPNLISEGENYYYKMPQPSKIYIGCRANGKQMNELIKIAKKNKRMQPWWKNGNSSAGNGNGKPAKM